MTRSNNWNNGAQRPRLYAGWGRIVPVAGLATKDSIS